MTTFASKTDMENILIYKLASGESSVLYNIYNSVTINLASYLIHDNLYCNCLNVK